MTPEEKRRLSRPRPAAPPPGTGANARVRIRIEGSDLPGRRCPPNGGFPGYDNIHVAVQRRGSRYDLLEPQPGDAASVRWEFESTVSAGLDSVDVRGPYIQGGPGKRFIYLSWVSIDAGGNTELFRRAKLFLADVAAEVLAAAAEQGRLVGRLGLTDPAGNPVCAWVRPPSIRWSTQ